MHPVLKSIVEQGWKADPSKRPTMAEICAELSRVDWLVFDGADAGRVKREAAGLPLSQSVTKAILQARLSEAQALVCGLTGENANLKALLQAMQQENSTLKSEVSERDREIAVRESENATLRWEHSRLRAELVALRGARLAAEPEAARCYKLSTDECNATGRFNHGVCLGEGRGVARTEGTAADHVKAGRRMAARFGTPSAALAWSRWSK
jgi:septal ring factor EnvC (AmiA/AmiB activator)